MKKKRMILIIILFIAFFIFIIAGLYSPLETTNYIYKSSKVPSAFDNYNILVLSDFHCQTFGDKEETLLTQIEEAKPDCIVLLGDVIDEDHQDLTPVSDLLSGLKDKYPIYAVRGNHEFDDQALLDQLEDIYDIYGVTRLYDTSVSITKDHSSIQFFGINFAEYYDETYWTNPDPQTFSVLLFHDASHFEETCKWGYDVILGGHVHGGIVRLPFVGGLFNNAGGLFCKYEKGEYHLNHCTQFSSAGLGNAIIPRFYNHPEIVCITLQHEE